MKAKQPAYWKAENLDIFDGARWLRVAGRHARGVASSCRPTRHASSAGRRRIKRLVRNLRTTQFITAGYAIDVDMPRPSTRSRRSTACICLEPHAAPRRHLHGAASTRRARPRTSAARAGADYDRDLDDYLTLDVPVAREPHAGAPVGPVPSRRTFPEFGRARRDARRHPPQHRRRRPDRAPRRPEGAGALDLKRTWALSQRLRDGANTPERLRPDACSSLPRRPTTSPTPRRRRRRRARSTGFLFDAKTGYCQQYSGAMALLLRMAGIPARVATGFSTGALRPQDRRVRRARLRRALVGRGLVPRLRLGHVRPDAGRLARRARQPADARHRRRCQRRRARPRRRRRARPSARRRHGRRPTATPWWQLRCIVAGAARRCSRSASLGVAPLAPRRAAGAARSSSARCGARAATPAPGHDAARARAALRRYARRPPATCARCASSATAAAPTPPDARPAPRPAVRARARRRAARPAARLVGAAARDVDRTGRLQLDRRWTTSTTSIQRGMALLEDGHFHQRDRPAREGPRPRARQDLDPRGARPRVLPLRASSRRRARSSRRSSSARRPTTTRCSASAAR